MDIGAPLVVLYILPNTVPNKEPTSVNNVGNVIDCSSYVCHGVGYTKSEVEAAF